MPQPSYAIKFVSVIEASRLVTMSIVSDSVKFISAMDYIDDLLPYAPLQPAQAGDMVKLWLDVGNHYYTIKTHLMVLANF